MKRKLCFILIISALFLVLMTGCVAVNSWENEYIGKVVYINYCDDETYIAFEGKTFTIGLNGKIPFKLGTVYRIKTIEKVYLNLDREQEILEIEEIAE